MSKQEELTQLFTQMGQENLPLRNQSPFIPGEGNPDAVLFFIGEAGGFNEAEQKRPFVGRAGQLLNSALADNGLLRSDVWITNVVKARPPQNRDPLPEEIEAYRPYLEKELAIIKPKIIVTLGRFAMNWFLPDAQITRSHGYSMSQPSGQVIFPLYHPAAALRSGAMMQAFLNDFAKLAELSRGDFQKRTLEPGPHIGESNTPTLPEQKSLFDQT